MSAADEAISRWRSSIPEELYDLRVWLLWEKRPKPNKPGKFDKIPRYPSGYQRHGANGGADDPDLPPHLRQLLRDGLPDDPPPRAA